MSSGFQQITGNVNSFNTVNFITGLDDEGRQILPWLSPLEPQRRHQGVRTDRVEGVGSWVLETSEFRKWRDADDGCVEQVLFCYGDPGVGKTHVRWRVPGLEKANVDIANNLQTIVPWLLIVCAIRLGIKALPSWGYTAISLPNKNSPQQICSVPW